MYRFQLEAGVANRAQWMRIGFHLFHYDRNCTVLTTRVVLHFLGSYHLNWIFLKLDFLIDADFYERSSNKIMHYK